MFEQFRGQNLIEFMDTFSTTEKCKTYLSHYKWKDGFICSKCNHSQHWKGIKPFTKVCKSCRHVESVTANTFFHKVKFDLKIAFFYPVRDEHNQQRELQHQFRQTIWDQPKDRLAVHEQGKEGNGQ